MKRPLKKVPSRAPEVIGSVKLRLEPYYGHRHYYPENSTAEGFCVLLGQKCLSEQQIRGIKKLGYKIEVKVNVPKF